MIKEALQYIISMDTPHFREIVDDNGDKHLYSDKTMSRIAYSPKAKEVLKMSTLSSLTDYIRGNIDKMADKMIIVVESPTRVSLISRLDNDRIREHMVEVSSVVPDFRFNEFMPSENFIIALQSKFIDTPDRALLLTFAGTTEAGTVAAYGDDGVSQKAVIRQGISSKTEAIVPNPVTLKPYRTFVEIDQPESAFIFRMKQGRDDEIGCALYEADGGAWRIEAVRNIKAYLTEALKDMPQFTVIS